MKLKNKAFTLVELIVVVTILAILWTIAFISFTWHTRNANNSKIINDIRNLTKIMETRLSKWESLDDLVLNTKAITNWVDTNLGILSGSYILADLTYEVWTFDFAKMRIDWTNFVYFNRGIKRDYIFAYVKTPQNLFYQFAWEIVNQDWKINVIIAWNYLYISSADARWLISENWFNIWLKNWDTLTWSLY